MRMPVAIVGVLVLFGLMVAACPAQIPGGYQSISVTDKDVIAAAKFAVETQSKKEKVTLVKIRSAAMQVVAGRNFRIAMDVRKDDKTRQAVAVVWAKLDGTYELTTWDWQRGQPQPRR